MPKTPDGLKSAREMSDNYIKLYGMNFVLRADSGIGEILTTGSVSALQAGNCGD